MWEIMNAEETKRWKAKQLRYKKPIVRDLNLDKVVQQLEKRSTLSRPVGWTKYYELVTLDDAVEIVKGGGN